MVAGETSQFLSTVSDFFSELLPIAGVIVLLALAVLFWEVIKIVKGLNVTVDKVNDIAINIDKSVEKLQAPLNTVESISYTVDSVHFASKRAVKKSVDSITDNYGIIKDWVGTFFEDKKTKKSDVTVSKMEEEF
ncbi:MAG TPA: histidine kinase [Erysipelotrichaceae bacterium]|nr:histidine kinase [Erysipelotrichaceae bacterium]